MVQTTPAETGFMVLWKLCCICIKLSLKRVYIVPGLKNVDIANSK